MFQGDTAKAYALFLPPIVDDPRPAPSLPNLIPALEATQRLSPGSIPTFVGLEHPTEMGQAVLINASRPGRLIAADSFYFDGKGELLDKSQTVESNLGEKILGSLGPLHFGWYGGILLKFAYGLLGLALTSVTASGVAIWLARRRDKGRPAPRWERIWIGTVWSQPLAFVASALLVVALGEPASVAPLALWGLVTVAVIAGSLMFEPKRLSAALRLGTAGVILTLIVVHIARHGAAYADPAAWGVNTALALIAAMLAASVILGRSKPVRVQP